MSRLRDFHDKIPRNRPGPDIRVVHVECRVGLQCDLHGVFRQQHAFGRNLYSALERVSDLVHRLPTATPAALNSWAMRMPVSPCVGRIVVSRFASFTVNRGERGVVSPLDA